MPPKDEEDADFSKACKDLMEAEKHAATLENQLDSLEQKLDSFLAEHDYGCPESDNSNASGSNGPLRTRVGAPQDDGVGEQKFPKDSQ